MGTYLPPRAWAFNLTSSQTKKETRIHDSALHQKHSSGDLHNRAHHSFQQAWRGLASQEPIVHHCPGFIPANVHDVSMTGYNPLDLPFRHLLRIASHQGVVNGRNVVNEAFRPYRSRMCTLCEFARERALVRRAWLVLLTEGQRLMSRARLVIARPTSVHGRFIIRSDCISVFVGL